MLLLALACQLCHAEIYENYIKTPMARTSGQVSVTQPGTFKQVRIDAQGVSRWGVFERKLDYFIGSGAHGKSFLSNRDGFLYQAPFTWYSQQQKWDASPGYEKDRDLRWTRPIEPNCLFCHASEPKPIYGTVNRYAQPPFRHGVTCERCHAGGADHKVVNPAKLDPERRDAVCAQCHLSGEARIEKADKRIAMFRPGEKLSDYVTYFVSGEGAMKATSHYEKLAASECRKASGDKLWCGTCHSPHKQISSQQACASCHTPDDCHRGPDCVSCHMPKRKVVDGGHGVLTDHSIPRRPHAELKTASTVLRPYPGYEVTPRELGLAYAEVGQRDKAIELLNAVKPDADVLEKLAFLTEQRGDVAKAAAIYRQTLKLRPHSMLALVNLGGIEARAGNYAQAEQLWKRALKMNPEQEEARRNLKLLQSNTPVRGIQLK